MTMHEVKKQIRRRIAAWALVVFVRCVRSLPEASVPGFGRKLGSLLSFTLRRLRKRAETQARDRLSGDRITDPRSLISEMFRHIGYNTVETIRLSSMTSEERLSIVDGEGIDLFRSVFNRGTGLIAVTGHIGCWELLAAYFSDLGFPVNVVARRRSNRAIGHMITELRASYGVVELDRESDGRKMFRALRRGEVLAMLVDQDTRVDGIFSPFLGKQAFTPTGHARLAYRTGAPIVVVSIHRQQSGRHRVTVHGEIQVPDGDETKSIAKIVHQCNESLSQIILSHPDQWIWFHRRWRRRPPHEKSAI